MVDNQTEQKEENTFSEFLDTILFRKIVKQ